MSCHIPSKRRQVILRGVSFRMNRRLCFPWWCFQESCCGSGPHSSGTGRLNEEDQCKPGTWGLNSNHVIQSIGCVCYELGRFTGSQNPGEHLWLPVPGECGSAPTPEKSGTKGLPKKGQIETLRIHDFPQFLRKVSVLEGLKMR